jgi:hypothetical protein
MEQLQERILVYGSAGSGKSYAWLSLARLNPEAIFHCIDTDASIDRMLQTEFRDLKNVKVHLARTWQKCEITAALIEKEAKTGDWIVIDMVDSLWDFVRADYIQNIFGKKIDEYYMEIRKSMKGGTKIEALKGWIDWEPINKTYQDLLNHLCYDLPQFNIFFTAAAANISSPDEQDLKDIFESIGAKPEGEKRNWRRVHTVLYLCHTTDRYVMTTAKDRGRKRFFAEQVTNFAEQYTEIMQGKEG